GGWPGRQCSGWPSAAAAARGRIRPSSYAPARTARLRHRTPVASLSSAVCVSLALDSGTATKMGPNEHANDAGRWPRVVVLFAARPHPGAGGGSPAVAAVGAGAVAVAVRPDDGAVGDHRRAPTGPDLQATAGPMPAVPRTDGVDQRGARTRLRRGGLREPLPEFVGRGGLGIGAGRL